LKQRHGAAGVLSRPAVPPLFVPADAMEKSRDLLTRTIGIFAMRKMSDAWKHREIEIS
jgi:hypothetical protein